ncbi:tRNA-specific 2-thiouridylase [Mycoplasmoides fastidiosum]|uniref:tRNA-specific 2-thiouridylase MnmA n=1 Tax=Mycoplasmoides fastidiosum TaxID=92758 RepID=A0ABU0LYG7_9BACT|nr:tRNA 2-thiouridine(34) synthase MnmA [Mycoplasmoides fastidiosum]MDQ0513658.1 tRNA-specific 2-thiouridylase [Mycoplasmoides fastidiosum]UUD37922.1 tRNA 2-thiouridine(34) synthase MnmA [Mycoplasmoides fastidiosum]
MISTSPKIIVALSGGVDSAVTAVLLKQQHPELQAVYMRNWDVLLNNDILGHKSDQEPCTDATDLAAVQAICQQLDIKLKVYNFVDQYWETVFVPSLEQLKAGQTPNPDMICNAKIKFGILLDQLISDFGPNIKIATGHYAGVVEIDQQFYLTTAANPKKDQTYFLSQLNQKQLSHVLFPLSHIKDKNEVRAIAKAHQLPVWNKKDSTGICFIGKRNYRQFMSNYLSFQDGLILDIQTKQVVGQHHGVSFYTLGQRKGLELSGYEQPMFVCAKNIEKNFLFVCPQNLVHKYLYKSQSRILNMHWINEPLTINTPVLVRFRHTGTLVSATISHIDQTTITLTHQLINTTAPGQYLVLYSTDQKYCLGGGILDESDWGNIHD